MVAGQQLREFRIAVPEAELDDLRGRLRRTRWPEAATASGWSQGVPLAVVRDWCRVWAEEYHWRDTEARLNRLPQHRVELGGGSDTDRLGIHLVHVRSPRAEAIPLLLTHGWPGGFLEFEATIAGLTDPASVGAPDAPAFHLVLPSLPGYGFSDKPTTPGWGIHRIARAWAELMSLLGYRRFVAAGSDWGTSVSTSLALQHPERLLGVHLVPPLVPPATEGNLTVSERVALSDLREREATGSAYGELHRTRPQTLGYGLLDSPAGLLAWIGEKVWSWAERGPGSDQPLGLTLRQLLDDVSLYWFTRTAASSARLYAESIAEVGRWFAAPYPDGVDADSVGPIDVPTGATVFPAGVPWPSRRRAERRFTRIVHWGEPAHGGHFGAWEQPALFVDELRTFATALRAAV